MTEPSNLLAPLIEQLEALKKRQENLSGEIQKLGDAILVLQNIRFREEIVNDDILVNDNPELYPKFENQPPSVIPGYRAFNPQPDIERPESDTSTSGRPPHSKSDIEKFIGENLINKIGIIITIIGVAIGAKYSIDHQLISPLGRIIMGYLSGLTLLGIGFKLKKNYQNYSAVLVSGAIAILYFITYFAYSLYDLLPQQIAFFLMVLFTAGAVFTAFNYDRQIIAHIGMVGAYGVPFLLGDSSGSVLVLFSYIAIVNIGILIISVKKYWKPLYYVSFVITWLTYFSWHSQKILHDENFGLALTFLAVFFAIFYAVFLVYKLLKKDLFDPSDVILLLANSFIFYGLGYSILKTNDTGEHLLGMFTLINGAIHFGVCLVIHRQKLADRNLFYMVAGLVLTFITIAIPVQLNGNWVTLLWAGEAALLFWIGRRKDLQFYELISYILIILTFISIIHDWTTVYSGYLTDKPETRIFPIFNINFLTSVLVIASFGFINLLNRDQRYPAAILSWPEMRNLISILIPGTLLIVVYYTFRIEIETYWTQLYQDSLKIAEHTYPIPADRYQNSDLLEFRSLWIINYSLLMMSVLSFVNIKKLRSLHLGIVSLVLSVIFILVFLFQGLYDLGQLRDSYMNHTLSEYYPHSGFNIGMRYLSYLFVGLTLFSVYKYLKQDFVAGTFGFYKIGFDCFLHLTFLWIASSELNSWMELLNLTQSFKLGLTIFWGLYALMLIALGIWKKKKYLRIGAILLFSVTLYKLFFFDIAGLDTIAKTIVLLSLGVLLLIISFLYNKYKNMISD